VSPSPRRLPLDPSGPAAGLSDADSHETPQAKEGLAPLVADAARQHAAPVKLYDAKIPSGNGYKVHLLLHHLDIPYTVEELDILATPPQTREPACLANNRQGT